MRRVMCLDWCLCSSDADLRLQSDVMPIHVCPPAPAPFFRLMISPKLATIVMLTVPPIILGGTIFGSILRHISSLAKDVFYSGLGLDLDQVLE